MNTPLSTDLNNPSAIPYFLWDEPLTVAQLREKLTSASPPEQRRWLAKILREARDQDVWLFTTPGAVSRQWDELAPLLGRRREFWRFLLGAWRDAGLLGHGPA
jgi:hypothetical protein